MLETGKIEGINSFRYIDKSSIIICIYSVDYNYVYIVYYTEIPK